MFVTSNIFILCTLAEIATASFRHSAHIVHAKCVCPTPNAVNPPVPDAAFDGNTCAPTKADMNECKIANYLGIVTRDDGLLRTIFSEMLTRITHNDTEIIIASDDYNREIDRCLPNLSVLIESDYAQDELSHIRNLKTTITNASILLRQTINALYPNDNGQSGNYQSPAGRDYYETAHFAFTQQLYCPVHWLAQQSTNEADVLSLGVGNNCAWNCRDFAGALCRVREQRVLEHLKNLIIMLKRNANFLTRQFGNC